MSMKEKHPVITGFGIVCCLGRNKDEVKENLMKGQTMFRPVSDKCDLGQLNDYLVGLCPVDEPAVNTANDYDKSEIMIRMTADEAFKDAGFDGDFSAFEERAAVSLATSLMGSEYLVKYSEKTAAMQNGSSTQRNMPQSLLRNGISAEEFIQRALPVHRVQRQSVLQLIL